MEENFGEKATVSTYAIYIFYVSVNIGEANFGEWLTIWQIRQFFPYQNFPVYSNYNIINVNIYTCTVVTLSLLHTTLVGRTLLVHGVHFCMALVHYGT